MKSKHEISEKGVKVNTHTHAHRVIISPKYAQNQCDRRPDLFKLVHVTHEERLENLFILLSDNSQVATAVIDLPCDLDALPSIKSEGHANVVQ